MSERLESILKRLPAPTAPVGLFQAIYQAIQEERWYRTLKRRVVGFASGLVALGVFVAGFWSYLADELARSSWFTYIQVLWTDRDVFFTYWKEISFGLLESLPVINVMVGLLVLFFILGLISFGLQARNHARLHAAHL